MAPAVAAAAAGPCHCAVGHAVHVFRWYLIDLKLVNRCHTSELDCSSPPAADAATQTQPLHPAPCDRKELLKYWNADAIYVGISQYLLDQGHIGFGVFAKKKLTVDMTLAERTLRAQLEVQLVQQQAKMAQLEQELTSKKAMIRNKLAHALGDLLAE